jgi:hypothetical protein
MAVVVPDASEIRLLELMLNVTSQDNPVLRAYTNDHTPSASTAFGDITESTVSGYSAITLTPGSWTITTDGSSFAVASYPEQTFTFSATETIYGYYVTNSANDTILWLERADFAPASITTLPGTFSVSPIFKARSAN